MFISLLTTWFGTRLGVALSRVLPYILAILLVVGVGLYISWSSYNRGVEDTTQRYEILAAEERDRLNAANQSALRKSNEKIEELEEFLKEKNAEILDLQIKAGEDVDADRPAINSGSVQRINRIR